MKTENHFSHRAKIGKNYHNNPYIESNTALVKISIRIKVENMLKTNDIEKKISKIF